MCINQRETPQKKTTKVVGINQWIFVGFNKWVRWKYPRKTHRDANNHM